MRQRRRGESALEAIGGIVVTLAVIGGIIWFINKDKKAAGIPFVSPAVAQPTGAAPHAIDARGVEHLFEADEWQVLVRNAGGAGYVLLTVTQEGKRWTRRAYFDAGEQRWIAVQVPGSKSGRISYRVDAD
jgi:hypothetical protein